MSTPASPLIQQTLSAIVTADSRTAAIFEPLGLDYCCHGHQTLAEASRDRGLSADDIAARIEALGPRGSQDEPSAWGDLDALTAFVVSRHHAYVRQATPQLTAWLEKLVGRHGARHPELLEIRRTFAEVAGELQVHMMKEENILFPSIDALAAAKRAGARLPPSPFGTILNPIRRMEEDHRLAGDGLARLRQLTDGYRAPADACTTFRACYDELARYEADLHRHVHLENHVLFPRAIALESELA
jgi:regulator of cell morphogenesis and NO signaling